MGKEKNDKEEKIIEEAGKIFSRYGFQRATMGDIAEAVKISRPALYLIFPSKEEILKAVISSFCRKALDEIRQNLSAFVTEKEKLMFAFEVWTVRPFEMVQTFPDTKDLLESSYAFAGQATNEAFTEFENILSDILEPLITFKSKSKLSAKQLAHILTSAIYGFKNASATFPDAFLNP